MVFLCKGLRPLHPPGAEPGRRWLRAGNKVPSGGLAFFAACRPCRLFTFLPLSPRPPSPPGKGETLGYFMQGASPLASPGLSRGGTGSTGAGGAMRYEPGRHWLRAGNRASGGGLVCFTRRVYFWYIIKILPPSPPNPLPLRGRGRLLVFLCKGLRPLHPRGGAGAALARPAAGGAMRYEPGRRWVRAGNRASGGGLAFFAACRSCRLFTFLPPSPQPPSPPGKGETLGYFMQGASPLASPGRSRGGAGSTGAGGALRMSRGGTGYGQETGHPAGACLLCRLPTLPFVYLPAPIPPTPFPPWGRGRL